jgi:hypothetical protein
MATAGPVGTSVIYDQLGTHRPLLVVLSLISLVAMGVMVFMKTESAFSPLPVPIVGAVDITSA